MSINDFSVLTTAVAVSATLILSICKCWRDKKNQSLLMARKINSLLQGIEKGLEVMRNKQEISLLEKIWKEKFITDEDMLIISAVSKPKKNKTEEFSANDIKKICENYFENIIQDYKHAINLLLNGNLRKAIECQEVTEEVNENSQKIKKCQKETENIIKILEQTKHSLEDNSKKRFFPK